jgi:hypothetical protein
VPQRRAVETLLLCKDVLPLPQLLRHPLELGTCVSGRVVCSVESVHPPVGVCEDLCSGRLHVRQEKLSKHLENARACLQAARRAMLATSREGEDVSHLAEDLPCPRGVASTGVISHLLHGQQQGTVGRVKDEAIGGDAQGGQSARRQAAHLLFVSQDVASHTGGTHTL